MTAPTNNLSVCVDHGTGIVRICGRANFSTSVDFKKVVAHLRDRCGNRLLFDLSECSLMDSTFLGVLASMAIQASTPRNGEAAEKLRLLNPTPRVIELLDNLGVMHLFEVVKEEAGDHNFQKVEPGPQPNSREMARNCLEAHQTLMDLNPENARRFKDVAAFLEEDARKPASEKPES